MTEVLNSGGRNIAFNYDSRQFAASLLTTRFILVTFIYLSI